MASLPIAAAAVAAPAIAAEGGDAELLAIAERVVAIYAEYDRITAELQPHDAALDYLSLWHPRRQIWNDKIDAFDLKHGRKELSARADSLIAEARDLQDRAAELPALSQAGRRAKVRITVLMSDSGCNQWRGPRAELYDNQAMVRDLLGEFAGMSEAELAAI